MCSFSFYLLLSLQTYAIRKKRNWSIFWPKVAKATVRSYEPLPWASLSLCGMRRSGLKSPPYNLHFTTYYLLRKFSNKNLYLWNTTDIFAWKLNFLCYWFIVKLYAKLTQCVSLVLLAQNLYSISPNWNKLFYLAF